MAIPTMITGLLLIVIGIYGYTSQDPDGKVSITAGIPAMLGFAIGLCGLVSLSEKFRKHAMHFAVTLGLIGAAGSPYPIIKAVIKGVEFELTDPKIITAASSTLVCLVFVGMSVNSFVQVRKARKKAAAAG